MNVNAPPFIPTGMFPANAVTFSDQPILWMSSMPAVDSGWFTSTTWPGQDSQQTLGTFHCVTEQPVQYLPLGSSFAHFESEPVSQWTPVWSGLFKAAQMEKSRREREELGASLLASQRAKLVHTVPTRPVVCDVKALHDKAEQIILADKVDKCGTFSSSSLRQVGPRSQLRRTEPLSHLEPKRCGQNH